MILIFKRKKKLRLTWIVVVGTILMHLIKLPIGEMRKQKTWWDILDHVLVVFEIRRVYFFAEGRN